MASTKSIDCNYLVIGAGAMGMAFVDTLLTDLPHATVAIVDRYDRPGGHWTRAYPFVRLHQPSLFYGVNSKPFENENEKDKGGWNEGSFEMAGGDEVVNYYGKVMKDTFLESGRVQWYGNCEYEGEGKWRSVADQSEFCVDLQRTKIVDATYMKVVVPSMRPPPYKVAEGVSVVSPNDLASIGKTYSRYTVVGGGKTGIDAALWLLVNGVPPTSITWIIPRDGWLFDRKMFQLGTDNFRKQQVGQAGAILAASSAEDLMNRLGSTGCLIRLDEKIEPTMFHCGTVSAKELEQLRKIEHVVRKGRVIEIEPDRVVLEKGNYEAAADTLYIDCTANGLAKRPAVPVFHGKRITLQPVRICQQVFSAAAIAHVEALYTHEDEKNDLCEPVPHPDKPTDWLTIMLQTQRNLVKWLSRPEIGAWVANSRLDYVHQLLPLAEDLEERKKGVEQSIARLNGLSEKLEYLLGTV